MLLCVLDVLPILGQLTCGENFDAVGSGAIETKAWNISLVDCFAPILRHEEVSGTEEHSGIGS